MNRLQKRVFSPRLKQVSLAVVTALGLSATSLPASAVESPVNFGEPIVLSQQGQRLKVLLPFDTAPNDRATAVAFLVEGAEAPEGYTPPTPARFTVMRPDDSPYVIFHSTEDVNSPTLSLTVSVMGDENSPYQMNLNIPGAGSPTMLTGADGRRAGRMGHNNSFRKLRGPVGRTDLPPK